VQTVSVKAATDFATLKDLVLADKQVLRCMAATAHACTVLQALRAIVAARQSARQLCPQSHAERHRH
jgi:pyrroline-5-carboxylate reductase